MKVSFSFIREREVWSINMKIVNVNEIVAEVFEVTGFDAILNIV